MPGAFTNVTVTTATPVAITATVVGQIVQIAEAVQDASYPVGDFLVFKAVPPTTSGASVPSATYKRIQAGGSYVLTKGFSTPQVFSPNEIVCFVQAVTGTMTIVVDEQGA